MTFLGNQRGQSLLELVIVFPVIAGFILAVVIGADRIALRLAVQWAARHAARSAAVHVLNEPCAVARAAATQSLEPWRLRSLDVRCVLQTPHGEKSLSDRPVSQKAARRARIRVRIDARARGRNTTALAEFPVMYAPE